MNTLCMHIAHETMLDLEVYADDCTMKIRCFPLAGAFESVGFTLEFDLQRTTIGVSSGLMPSQGKFV